MPSKNPTKVQFTVGKLDAGMAILLTQDHHQIEFPSILLPETVTTGSIIDLSVTRNPEQEMAVHQSFIALQKTIRETFAGKSPSTPNLQLRNATQTSAVLEWDPIDIAMAELKSLTLWRDGTRLGNIPKPLTTTTTKLSGLAIDTSYTFQLKLKTTAGQYDSEPLKVQTHKLTNLSGITVCEGTLPPEQHDRLVSAIDAIGAKPLQKRVRIDTTHFICSVPEGEEHQRAKDMNVPIVVVDWIEACQSQGKIVGVRGYYLDADPALRPTGSLPPQSPRTTQTPSTPARTSVTEKPSEGVSKAERTGAVDQENERVLHTAEEVAPPVIPEVTVTPAAEPAPEKAPEPAPVPVAKTENEPTAKAEARETEGTAEGEVVEEKFEDVPI
jgi:chitin biosynthesis protein CHS5